MSDEQKAAEVPVLAGHEHANDYQVVELRGGPGPGIFRIIAPSADAVVSEGVHYTRLSPGLYVSEDYKR